MAIGVLTGGGVRISSTPIVGDNKGTGSKKGLPEKMLEIDSAFQEFKKRDLEKGSKSVKMSIAIEQVKNVISLLNESDKASMKCFVYSSLMSGIKGQEILIDIAIHCLTFVDFVDFDFKGLYFDVLNLIFQRGELELGQVGIFEKASMRHGNSYVNAKKKLAVKYQFLLNYALRYSLDKLARKSVDFYKRDFIALNIGIAYFKIPEFRERFMNAIMKEKLVKIPEWKNFHWNLEDGQEDSSKTIDHFFNWQEYFYDQIPESEQKKKNLSILAVVANMK